MIEPYYEEPNIKIYCGDCLQTMPMLSDSSIDLVVADPPFGIDFKDNTTRIYSQGLYKKQVSRDLYYDDFKNTTSYSNWSKEWLSKIYRILKDTGVFVLFSGWTNVSYLDVNARECGFKILNHCIWHYEFGVFCSKKFVTSHYSILIFVKNLKKYTTNIPKYTEDVITDIRRTDKISFDHPCSMTIKLPKRLITYFSNENDFILDPFLGSGTTLVACKELNRKGVGIEISQKYCDIAVQRLKNTTPNLL